MWELCNRFCSFLVKGGHLKAQFLVFLPWLSEPYQFAFPSVSGALFSSLCFRRSSFVLVVLLRYWQPHVLLYISSFSFLSTKSVLPLFDRFSIRSATRPTHLFSTTCPKRTTAFLISLKLETPKSFSHLHEICYSMYLSSDFSHDETANLAMPLSWDQSFWIDNFCWKNSSGGK